MSGSAEAESGCGLLGSLTSRVFFLVLFSVSKGLLQAPLASFKQLGSHLVMGLIKAREPPRVGQTWKCPAELWTVRLQFKESPFFLIMPVVYPEVGWVPATPN